MWRRGREIRDKKCAKCIMMDEWLVDDVVEVYRIKCSIERVHLVCEREILSFMGAYMPQAGKIKPLQ
jgi:hypothetical protein